ncbi:uncharacterized protein, partial [Chelonus insularis]|uniref:uncharacterized protein n=1 Tax=Chelonus insularis TaxID=460826 RepID=UPI00158E316C
MDLKNRYAFVAMFDGKKVKKYFKTLEELVGIEWITETKFWTRNEDSAYCEGIVLAKDENERTLRDRVSKKSLRIPHNAFKPFPDPLTGEKFTESQMPKKSSVETIKDKEVNGSTILRNLKEHKVDHHAIAEEIGLQQKDDSTNFTKKQPIKDDQQANIQNNITEMLSEKSSEDDESPFSSKKAVPFVENGSKILTFTNPEKKILKHTFVIQPNQSTTMEKEATNE